MQGPSSLAEKRMCYHPSRVYHARKNTDDFNRCFGGLIQCCCCSITKSCLTLCDCMDCSQSGCPWDFPGKNTGVGCHSLLQGIFLDQGLNPHLLHWQAGSLSLSHQGSLSDSLACLLSHFSYVRLCVALWTVALQAPLSVEFSGQEYWSGLPCLPPGDLPDPRIKPVVLKSHLLHWQEGSLPPVPPDSLVYDNYEII